MALPRSVTGDPDTLSRRVCLRAYVRVCRHKHEPPILSPVQVMYGSAQERTQTKGIILTLNVDRVTYVLV